MENRETRLHFWDEKLQTKRHFTPRELLKAFEQRFKKLPAIRTFREDIKALRERGAPLRIERLSAILPL